jgi:acetolactate synthase I/II/III large subunit
MAIGYHFATGKVGVASTTCGPGFTQITTALTSATHARVPLVVFTADAPLGLRWYNQTVDQASITKGTGAHFLPAHSPELLLDHVQEAFYIAQFEQRPVVLSVPYDLLDLPAMDAAPYVPSREMLPSVGRMPPNPDAVERAAQILADAKLPLLIGGRGAVWSDASSAVEALAESTGALLGNTLPARGMFDRNPFSLGVIGGYSSELAKEVLANADCVISFGASLTQFTVASGRLFPKATVIQVDQHPRGLQHGRRAADIYVRADAKLGAEAIAEVLAGKTPKTGVRTPELARAIAERPVDARRFDIEPGTIDPREAIAVLDRIIPKDWDIVSGTGNSSYFYTHMRGREPRNFHVLREFGAIGSGLSTAIGVAVARGNGKVVLLDGDGGVMMHIQELETIQRQGIQLLIVTLNDGGFGAEFHRLRPIGKDDSLTFFGRPDFAKIAKAFGLGGTTASEPGEIETAFASYDPNGQAMVLNIHISDKVGTPTALRKTT